MTFDLGQVQRHLKVGNLHLVVPFVHNFHLDVEGFDTSDLVHIVHNHLVQDNLNILRFHCYYHNILGVVDTHMAYYL